MTAEEKINKIIETIKSGKTVYVTTALRSTKVTPRTLARWEKSGHKLFKSDAKNMYMASGNKFVCIDGCRITVEG